MPAYAPSKTKRSLAFARYVATHEQMRILGSLFLLIVVISSVVLGTLTGYIISQKGKRQKRIPPQSQQILIIRSPLPPWSQSQIKKRQKEKS